MAVCIVADAQDKTTADNGGTVIVDTSGMRWKRVFKELSLYDFGYDKSKIMPHRF